MVKRLGDILVQRGEITQVQLESALRSQGSERGMLGALLVRRGLISLDQLGSALAEQYEVPFQEIGSANLNPQLIRLLPESFARDRSVATVALREGRMRLAMAAPDDIDTIAEVELLTGYGVDPVISLENEIQAALDRGFDERIVARQTIVDMKLAEMAQASTQSATALLTDEGDMEAPVVRLVRAILLGAINAGASDIHLEPFNPEMRVRYRVDGQLQAVMTIPDHIEESVIARIKVMADMDTTEIRRPQDGHLSIKDTDGKVNFRVSTIPTVDGEKVVLRLLDEGNQMFDINKLGLSQHDRACIERLVDKPHGMIVVTGPTGSGKSTTLYAMLSKMNLMHRNIVTVEDPVEYRLPGVNQVQSDNDFGLGFANALKYMMRQDPDVIMVGEIRDHETAGTAIQAALTGHLLITTLHTNDAVGSTARLIDLGIDAYKVGGALLGSIAQRLLRSICPACKEPADPSAALLRQFEHFGVLKGDETFFQGRGCKKCLNSGFQGRIPIFEIMEVTPNLTEAIENGASQSQLREIAASEGMVDLAQAGLQQAICGNTTLGEVLYKTSS